MIEALSWVAMALIFLIFASLRPLFIFISFTFTDWEDFLPLASLVLCAVAGVALVVRQRAKGKGPVALLSVLALWPILPNIGLYFLAREVVKHEGHWPQVMVDDPKNKSGLSPEYDAWMSVTVYLEAFSGVWLCAFLFFAFLLGSRLSKREKLAICSIAALAMLVFLADFGSLYEWWLD